MEKAQDESVLRFPTVLLGTLEWGQLAGSEQYCFQIQKHPGYHQALNPPGNEGEPEILLELRKTKQVS